MATREEDIKKINDQLEQLSDEQLEQVAGGSISETKKDTAFFQALHLDVTDRYTSKTFSQYGVEVIKHIHGDNYYKMGGDQKYPREAALGFVLARMNYPGYNGNWGDIPYTVNFIREHLGDGIV